MTNRGHRLNSPPDAPGWVRRHSRPAGGLPGQGLRGDGRGGYFTPRTCLSPLMRISAGAITSGRTTSSRT